jgi:SAM-dependent methyltransferase
MLGSMRPEELGQSYDEIAEDWLAPGLQSDGIPQFERAIRFAGSHGYALDIGCGCSGRFFDLLVGHGFQVEGVDVSARMVELSHQRRPNFPVQLADICQWDFPRKYDFISAWDSTWHDPLAKQESLWQKICGGLTPGGVFIFTTGGVDGPEEATNTHMGPPVHFGIPGIPRTLELLTMFGCVCRHLEYDQLPERHVYVIAQKL